MQVLPEVACGDEGMNKLAEIDAKMIDLTQDAYLWLYDRCGIYIATVSVVLLLAGEAISYRGPIGLVLTGFICLSISPRYLLQMMGLKDAINAMARSDRTAKWRYIYIVLMLILILAPGKSWGSFALGAACDLAALAYVNVVQLRDREPKDFLPQQASVGSHA